jgi:hypothetical protein
LRRRLRPRSPAADDGNYQGETQQPAHEPAIG